MTVIIKEYSKAFVFQRPIKFFVLFFKLGRERSTRKDMLIKLSPPLPFSHEITDPLTPAKRKGVITE